MSITSMPNPPAQGLNPRCESVGERVWRVRAPLDEGYVSLYILKGRQWAVIDTGYAHHPETILVSALGELGCDLASIGLILNTHGHPDHLGGNHRVKLANNALVYLHANDAHLAAGPEAHFTSENDLLTAFQLLDRQEQIAQRQKILRIRVEGTGRADQIVQDSQLIDLGDGMRIRVIHTPGHTPGSVTYLLEGQGIAFTGDTVQGIGAWPGWFPYYWDVAALVGSLHRLQGLAIQKLCPSHAYCWRGCQGEPEPIRWGAELVQTLEDSLAFIASLDQACHSTRMSVQTLTVDRIMAVLERLKFPTGALQGDGSPTPAAAATIWAHLSYADRNPEL